MLTVASVGSVSGAPRFCARFDIGLVEATRGG
jgi:hypothetical protein